MPVGKFVFAQLMDFLPRHEFDACVRRYGGDRRERGFSCRDQWLCLSFVQLTFRESLRDIETCLRALDTKLYHAGFRGRISRSTLADANQAHDWRIFADFARPSCPCRAFQRSCASSESFVASLLRTSSRIVRSTSI